MYVIIHKKQVLLGPRNWNHRIFQEFLEEELGISFQVPAVPQIVTVNEDTKILPTGASASEEFDSRIQFLNGPYWTFTDTEANSHYVAEYLPLDAAKNMLRSQLPALRYAKEIAGVDVEVQGQIVRAYTSREDRSVYLEAVQLAPNDEQEYNFKFMNNVFLAVNRIDLGIIIAAVAAHIQAVFDWERSKNDEINACTSHQQLLDVIIDDLVPTVIPPGAIDA